MTNYHFESLGHEKFQQLCQSVLTALNPNTICYPLGMSDGGRDAVVPDKRSGRKIVFQVKYLKDPSSKGARQVILEAIRTESKKIQALKKSGIDEYYLLTNVPGSSQLDVGSMDSAEKMLSTGLGIDAHCWWRDDISMRLNNLPEVKWSFVEILKGGDILRQLVMSSGRSREEDAATKAVEAYVSSQRVRESQLKFKQIELAKGILELFTDVPARLQAPPTEEGAENSGWFYRELDRCGVKHSTEFDEDARTHRLMVGAMQLLSNQKFAKDHSGIVVEGAPGQGKSTVTQYLCQVHRLLLLNREDELRLVPPDLLPVDVRIPFRIDLRDYATWLLSKNPFSENYSDPLPSGTSPILERFIAAQVSRFAGSDFSVSDLRWIAGRSNILIVLDGFDEVADIAVRSRIVSEATEALERLRQGAISCQLIVTSRPTAFSDSPGFPKGDWRYMKLLPLSAIYIKDYSERWLVARGADPREIREMRSALSDSMRHAHVRDLARNPMQLSILLSLMSVQGVSLPNKRTSLYDKYIDVFFNRESEKSRVIRENRDLIIQIHGYVAWILQLDAEDNGAGNVTPERLRLLVKGYLEKNGYPINTLDELFIGVTERVVALVSRVEGTFEFEVQPLREYFAARFIYDSAPYVVASLDRGGTKPDRFRALICSFFWRNVARFYAGCYSSGELASMVEGLIEIGDDPLIKASAYPARLGAELLVDQVFSSQPRLAERLLRQMDKSKDLPVFAASVMSGSFLAQRMPDGAARITFCEILKNAISDGCPNAYVNMYANLLSINMWPEEKIDFLQSEASDGLVSSRLMRSIGGVVDLSEDFLTGVCVDNEVLFATSMFFHNRFDVLEKRLPCLDLIVGEYMRTPFFVQPRISSIPDSDSVLRLLKFVSIFSDYRLWDFESSDVDYSGRRVADIICGSIYPGNPDELYSKLCSIGSKDHNGTDWSNFDHAYSSLADISASEFSERVDLLNDLIEATRVILGDCGVLFRFAISVVAMVRAGSEGNWLKKIASVSGPSLLGDVATLHSHADCVFWRDELSRLLAESELDGAGVMLIAVMFNNLSVASIVPLIGSISPLLDRLDAREFDFLRSLIEDIEDDDIGERIVDFLPSWDKVTPRVAYCLSAKIHSNDYDVMWRHVLAGAVSADAAIAGEIMAIWIRLAKDDPEVWSDALSAAKRNFASSKSDFYLHSVKGDKNIIPLELACGVCSDAFSYPPSVVEIAVRSIDAEVGRRSEKLGEISVRQGWMS